jgi:hypothetical protein
VDPPRKRKKLRGNSPANLRVAMRAGDRDRPAAREESRPWPGNRMRRFAAVGY